jgi:hypothetical protein
MIGSICGGFLGEVKAMMVSGRGFTPEEVAEMALDKIIYISASANPILRDQAEAYKAHLRVVLVHYMKQAVTSHNTTLINRFTKAGHPELVKLLEN